MKTTYEVLFPSGEVQRGIVYWPVRPGSDLIATLVKPFMSGEPIEVARIAHPSRGYVSMVLCDRGHERLSARAPLSQNPLATARYRESFVLLHPSAEPEHIPPIVGAAVVFDREIE